MLFTHLLEFVVPSTKEQVAEARPYLLLGSAGNSSSQDDLPDVIELVVIITEHLGYISIQIIAAYRLVPGPCCPLKPWKNRGLRVLVCEYVAPIGIFTA